MSRTLILVHGFMGSALNWGPILTRLKSHADLQGWRFLTPDLLGHGGRRGPGSLAYRSLTHEILVEDLKTQLPEAGNFIALGHSFGIRPLLSIASDPAWSSRFQALIVEDASPEITPENARGLHRIFDSIHVPFESRLAAKTEIDLQFSHNPRLAAFLFSNIRAVGEQGHTWRFDREGLVNLLIEAETHPLWSEWTAYRGPVHILQGAQSDHLDQIRLQRALETRRGQETHLVQIDQSGHWIHSDQPDKFTEELVKILKRYESKS